MDNQTLRVLVEKLNPTCASALEAAAGFAVSRGHFEIGVEHMLLKLMENASNNHLNAVLSYFKVDQDMLWQGLIENINGLRSGQPGKPGISQALYQLLEKACLAASIHYNDEQINSASLLDAAISLSAKLPGYQAYQPLDAVNLPLLHQQFAAIVHGSEELATRSASASTSTGKAATAGAEGETALDRFTTDLTARARSGKLDAISGRNAEIRMAIDILCRRRKNNPLLVGEPGVGKTAIVEGLAQKIVAGEVPDLLKNVRVCVLDLGLLQAGAGVKGEFERRLKQVIEEVEAAAEPVMLFIDEAHTLVGAGGEAGMSDAANLLKPALARGELRTVAATTWREYKQYFERDPALARRFQMVKVEEPDTEAAIHMLSGIKTSYEGHHGVQITDEALETAVLLSQKYITGRYLPDKAIDLIDTAAARVRMGQAMPPQSLESLNARIAYLQTRLQTLHSEHGRGLAINQEVFANLRTELEKTLQDASDAEQAWQEQSQLVQIIHADTRQLDQQASSDNPENLDELLAISQLRREALADLQTTRPLVQPEVNALSIADVVADWTGIPVGSMVKDELHNLLTLEASLMESIVGQDAAIGAIGRTLRASKAGLKTSDGPLGVFLLAGPSGVGKTETARGLARQLFGSEKALVTINMSEYQEAHTVSQLKGSPPGYVGYGQGGLLSEAVRQRPYCVVLLDEVEKAHVDVMNLFYQVFDRGFMRDGEGREIDFKNTVILMTSNLGANVIQQRFEQTDETANYDLNDVNDIAELQAAEEAKQAQADEPEDEWQPPSFTELAELVRPEVLAHFAPALVARMQLVPFNSLSEESLQQVVGLKLEQLATRLQEQHGIQMRCDEAVMDYLTRQCRFTDSGARYVNALLEQQLMPGIAAQLLTFMAEDDMPDVMTLELDEAGELCCTFADIADEVTEANPAEESEHAQVSH
ncbi:type VI secretion system ATPase TssH [Aliidiomarina soli]|uniref:Type VI secretion system ATPase TssH n=1 Tax=Aliidiomarina soli TaxID=1928574 RepID=A0A432WJ12_9GAMM|nr:type VI secretion system ATPase TssH [Aliidiomarina soli]RUO33748.1 type VI secretion system ATPase TssH [Aliidiomarina soli]